ncbi:hypothetical protein [Candidatus Dactylopiibacterium carminicum]|uniref:hypothetical protein n=1 Tax=Candidatus Dactylopiibacterium carminicum TaxID=857335 RepID=UPI001CC27D4A|nr:hypothetical protein [Candidatus Dactylopiibacterium carminicum]
MKLAPATHLLLPEPEDELLLDEEDDWLLELLEEALLLVLEPEYEHQRVPLIEFDGNNEAWHVNEPVSVAYTNVPDLPKATERVPLMLQVSPSLTHLV